MLKTATFLLFAFSAALLPLTGKADPDFDCSQVLTKVMTQQPLAPQISKRALEEIDTLKVGTFNTYNLLRSADGSWEKPLEKQLGLAKPILDQDLDIVVLQEVNDIAEAQTFISRHLNNAYEAIMAPTNDSRGIQIAYIVKRDLPLHFELTSSRELEALYEVTGQVRPVFSRDVPSLRLWTEDQSLDSPPLFSILGTHFKSKRSIRGDEESRILRSLQNEAAAFVIGEEKKQNPDSVLLFAGDFNGDIHNEAAFTPIREIMTDSLDTVEPAPSTTERITHSYHPREGPTKYSQLDAIFTAPEASEFIVHSEVYRYTDSHGNEIPLPRTWDERNENPSDHFPVFMRIDLQLLLQQR